jgi:hypothetical protein
MHIPIPIPLGVRRVAAVQGTVAFGFDPNAGNPEPRKALGRRQAVSGASS